MIAEICAIRENIFSRFIQNVLQKCWMQIVLGIIVTKSNQSVQVFSCMRSSCIWHAHAGIMHVHAVTIQALHSLQTLYKSVSSCLQYGREMPI